MLPKRSYVLPWAQFLSAEGARIPALDWDVRTRNEYADPAQSTADAVIALDVQNGHPNHD